MMPIEITGMNWLNPPPESRVEDGRLICRSGGETDFWQGTYYGFHRDSGHFLHQPRQGDFTAEVTFAGRYEALYDQAGLMLRADDKHWMKCGIEFTDGARHFSTVVTNTHSDWSAFRLPEDFEALSVRVTRMGDALFVQYRTDTQTEWRMARLAWFPPEIETLSVGPTFCSPQRAGFEVEFSDFSVKDVESREIHS
jgi:regulation of enolase protein 1 (concanavalin A-like superfamily)